MEQVDKSTGGKGDPLHGITLETILNRLVTTYGWQELGKRIAIKCFTTNPSVASSLKFLRRTPWARAKVEALYLRTPWTLEHQNAGEQPKSGSAKPWP